jgi:hypothetical protein
MLTGRSPPPPPSRSQPKIFARQFVTVLVFEEIKVEVCSRVTQTHNTLLKIGSEIVGYTKKIKESALYDFCPLQVVQTGSGAHPASTPPICLHGIVLN